MTAVTDRLIGREAELATLVALLDGPIDGLQVILVEGDPGIGKSTLWRAAVDAALERAYRVLISRPAESERSLPNLVLGDLFGDVTPAELETLPVPRRRAMEAALLREESVDPIDPRALGAAIHTLLPVIGANRRLVIAIDDEQWVDPSSAASLRFALSRSGGRSIVLLLSRRLGQSPTIALDAVTPSGEVERVHVGPMSVGAIQTLLRQRLGTVYARPTLVRLHEISGGNPFYALELARAGSVDPRREPTARLAVPGSLEVLVVARLRALPPSTRRVLLLVAAYGRLPVGLLRTLDVDLDLLDPAFASKVIETVDGRIRFTHPLLASVLYEGATSAERRIAHRRLADVLSDPVDRGPHLAQATDEPDDDIARELESASLAATRRGIPIAAADLADHAVHLTPSDSAGDRHRRAILAGRAHLASGNGDRARAISDELALRAPVGPRRAEALHLRAAMEDPGEAVAILHEALAEATGTPELEAVIHVALAGAESATEDHDEAERHAAASLRLAEEVDSADLRARALSVGALLRFDRGDHRALDDAELAYRLAVDLGNLETLQATTGDLAWIMAFSGDYPRARKWLESRLDDWGDRDEQMRSLILWMLAQVEVWTGGWDAATAHAQEVTEIGLQYGETAPDHLAPALLAMHRGQLDLARAHSRRAIELVTGHLLPQHLAVLGVCDHWSGSLDSALGYLAQAEDSAAARGWDHPNLHWWRPDLVECLLQLGRSDEAAAVVANWEASAIRLGSARVVAQAVRCQGLIAAAAGELRSAADLLDDAAARLDALDDPFGHSRALLSLGIVRLRLREKLAARVALDSALSTFERLGAAGWATRSRAELARIGGRRRVEGLSPSEARVASLVAEGRTNREIAATLFLGEATVASHLSHIYAKLGIRSRTELARLHPLSAPTNGDRVTNIHRS